MTTAPARQIPYKKFNAVYKAKNDKNPPGPWLWKKKKSVAANVVAGLQARIEKCRKKLERLILGR